MSEMIRVKVRVAEGTDTYVIHDVSSDDEGRYFCRVTNTFGSKEVFVDVRMLGERRLRYQSGLFRSCIDREDYGNVAA